ncbi:MAG: phage tail protein [Solirubrobacteraceae bacterium]
MSRPFIGEIRLFAGTFAPQGWAFCDGQLLPISENDALFNLIGTTYGGDGQSTFALPDLRGRVPLHSGSGFTQAQTGGVETVTLTGAQLPVHQHAFQARTAVGAANSPANTVYAQGPAEGVQAYTQDNSLLPNPTPIAHVGGNQPHENRQPLVAVSFILSLFGVFPTQN